jgi:hypothetical protein
VSATAKLLRLFAGQHSFFAVQSAGDPSIHAKPQQLLAWATPIAVGMIFADVMREIYVHELE